MPDHHQPHPIPLTPLSLVLTRARSSLGSVRLDSIRFDFYSGLGSNRPRLRLLSCNSTVHPRSVHSLLPILLLLLRFLLLRFLLLLGPVAARYPASPIPTSRHRAHPPIPNQSTAMCYFEQTRWACGYWRWGHFRQQCNKEYRMGETCGLKLVYETKTEPDVCKLCHDTEKKQRRYDKMYRDVQRWQREGNRSATIERTCGEMHDVMGQIYRMREEHDHRLQSLGQVRMKHVHFLTFLSLTRL
ncbi:hypothetical protein CDV31_012178 [Fusarium ambrosium]|uniref:Uncharacterized protein n=2 Tax=Fusarium solani species complex TaxID=232080 RepID=A0A428TBQ7_9HYPO|nr:hypothetical protein CDV31_012178 [Fusarium ambrosium]